MNINDIVNVVSSCGFPIFACIYLARTQGKQLEKLGEIISRNTQIIDELRKQVGKK